MASEITLVRDPVDNTDQVQAAIDSLSPGGMVRLTGDPQPWTFKRPVVIDRTFTGLAGQPWGQTRLWGTSCYGPVIAGIRNLRKASLSHWSNAASQLDVTAFSDPWGAPTPRYSIRTKTPTGQYARLSFSASPFSEGPHQGWSTVNKLTIDFAFILHAATGNRVNLFGCQDATGRPGPYYLYSVGGISYLDLCTTTNDRLRLRVIWSPLASLGQLVRFSLQLNFFTGEHLAFVNSQRVTSTTDGVPLTGTLRQPDEGLPFGIGAVTCLTHEWDQTGLGGGPTDLETFGFRLTNEELYTPATTQTRIDAQAINDRLSYFTAEPKTLAFLPLSEIPSDRLVRWQSAPLHDLGMGDVHGYGYLLDPANGPGGDSVGGHLFQDLEFSAKMPYGGGLTLGAGPSANVIAERCNFVGGAYAFHSLNTYCSYTTSIRDCSFTNGWIASYRAWNHIAKLDNCHFYAGYRHSMCLTGCTTDMYGGSLDGDERRISSVRLTEGQYGAGFSWKNGYIDFEGPYPVNALFDVTASSAVVQTYCNLERIGFPGVPAGKTLFILRPRRQITSYQCPARLSLADCGFIGNITVPEANGAGMAQVTGSGWTVATSGDPWSSRPQGVPLVIDAVGNVITQ